MENSTCHYCHGTGRTDQVELSGKNQVSFCSCESRRQARTNLYRGFLITNDARTQEGNGMSFEQSESFREKMDQFINEAIGKGIDLIHPTKEGHELALKVFNENNTGANDYTDFEKDERYTDLLDEEAKKIRFYNNSFERHENFKDFKHLSGYSVTYQSSYLKVQISAQRRYFIELLKEKDKTNAYQLELNQSLLKDKLDLMQEKDRLTSTIAERDNELQELKDTEESVRNDYHFYREEFHELEKQLTEAKATIEKLTKELESHTKKCKQYIPGMDTSMSCINCGKQKLEHSI